MLSMVRSHLYRLAKTRYVWGYALCYALIVYLSALAAGTIAANQPGTDGSAAMSITAARMYGNALAGVAPIVASLLLSTFICEDFKSKAIKNVIQARGGRVSYALAAAVAAIVVCAATMAVGVVSAEIAYRAIGFSVTGYDLAGSALLLCQVFFVTAAYASIAVFIAILTARETLSFVAAVVVSSGMAEMFVRVLLANSFEDIPVLRDCLDGYLGARMAMLQAGMVSDAVVFAVAVVTVGAAVAGCVFVMKRRDLGR